MTVEKIITKLCFIALITSSVCLGNNAFCSPIELKKDTEITLVSLQPMAPVKSKVGDKLKFKVKIDVKSKDGIVLIAKDTIATGKVTRSHGARLIGANEELDFTIDPIKAVDGHSVRVNVWRTRGSVDWMTHSATVVLNSEVFEEGDDVRVGTDEKITIDPDNPEASDETTENTVANDRKADVKAVELKKGTEVILTSLQALMPVKTKVGTAVFFEVKKNVRTKTGDIVIPMGTKLSGKVTVSRPNRVFGGGERIDFSLDPLVSSDGTKLSLKSRIGGSDSIISIDDDQTIKEGDDISSVLAEDIVVSSGATWQQPAGENSEASHKENTPASEKTKTRPEDSNAAFRILFSSVAGSNVLGKVENTGRTKSDVEIIVFITKNDKPVGSGSVVLRSVDPSEKRSFSVPIEGSTEGEIDVSANPKD